MFTGLIEEQGKIINVSLTSNGMELTIACNKVLEDIKLGASICVNGACQTVTKFTSNSFTIQATNETLNVTTFKTLKKDDLVNLERALTLTKRIDGHIVSGHIDCLAKFEKELDNGFSKEFFFEVENGFEKYIIYKGSIAINGVSLTVASIKDNIFSVALIPTTLKEVNLSSIKIGDKVNIETDMFAKYVEKIFGSKDNNSKLDYNFLAENGFV